MQRAAIFPQKATTTVWLAFSIYSSSMGRCNDLVFLFTFYVFRLNWSLFPVTFWVKILCAVKGCSYTDISERLTLVYERRNNQALNICSLRTLIGKVFFLYVLHLKFVSFMSFMLIQILIYILDLIVLVIKCRVHQPIGFQTCSS